MMKSLILIRTAVVVFVNLTPCVQDARYLASPKNQAITPQVPAIKAEPLDLLKGLEGYPAEDLTRTFNGSNKKLCIVNKKSDNQGSVKEQGTLRYCIESAKNATKDEMESYIKDLDVQLSTIGDDAQLANIDLQNALQKQQQTLQTMSNVSKMLHDSTMANIRKIG